VSFVEEKKLTQCTNVHFRRFFFFALLTTYRAKRFPRSAIFWWIIRAKSMYQFRICIYMAKISWITAYLCGVFSIGIL